MSGIQGISVSAAQTFATVSPQGQQSLQPFANLDLTEAQRTQLRSIFTAAKQNGTSPDDVKQQIDSVLSPAQQKTLAQDVQARGGHRGQHRHSDTKSSASDSSAAAVTQPGAASGSSTVPGAVTNVHNQVTAANSTLLETLQQNVLAGTGTTAVDTPPAS